MICTSEELHDRAWKRMQEMQRDIVAHTRAAADHFESVAEKLVSPNDVARRISLLLLGDTP